MPSAIVAMAAGNRVRPVWRNELGGLTFEMTGPAGRRFVKWAPAGTHLNLMAEASRLRWAAPFTPVPAVLGEGRDGAGSWLITAGLPGRNAVDAIWKAEPLRAVQAIGRGLRAFHEALPVAECPFSWSVRPVCPRWLRHRWRRSQRRDDRDRPEVEASPRPRDGNRHTRHERSRGVLGVGRDSGREFDAVVGWTIGQADEDVTTRIYETSSTTCITCRSWGGKRGPDPVA